MQSSLHVGRLVILESAIKSSFVRRILVEYPLSLAQEVKTRIQVGIGKLFLFSMKYI
jgi:hypothetical protein